MKYPYKSTDSHKILETVMAHGPITIDQGIAIHGIMQQHKSRCMHDYGQLVKAGWLNVTIDGFYFAAQSTIDHFSVADKPASEKRHDTETTAHTPAPALQVTPPAQLIEKPWSGKYLPKATANRNDADQRPEHTIFVSGTTPEPFRGVRSL